MDFVTVCSAILSLLAGIGIFLIACQMMSSNLESASSSKLKQLFAGASKNKLIGVGIGAVGTATIQSSGATTVMTIGFVNAGIISLSQAATIIYGANIGTTITAQIVSLGMFGANAISTTLIFSAFAGIGALITLFTKKNNLITLGGIFAGFGMLFVGLSLMSHSMEAFAALDEIKIFLSKISSPLLLVFIGTIFTGIIQSSSVMTSIALTMVVSGLISLDQGIFITMGSNIGSCVVAIIAGVTSGINAKRTALMHLIFNCLGVFVFLIVSYALGFFSGGSLGFSTFFDSMFPGVPQTQLAMFHTFFNITTVLIMLPLTELLVSIVIKLIPDHTPEEVEPELRLTYLDKNMLLTPPLAVAQMKKEILGMFTIAMDNFDRAIEIITSLDFSQRNIFNNTENRINFIHDNIVEYSIKLSDKKALSEKDHLYLSTTFRTVRDVERIGDYAENIVEYADALRKDGQIFSEYALDEIEKLKKMVHALYDMAVLTYEKESWTALAEAKEIEEQIDDYTEFMEDNHIKRLEKGVCTPQIGARYLELSSNTERIADHIMNVASSITHYVDAKG